MTDMIERVAGAMCNAAHEGDDGSAARDWNSNQSIYRDMARAALTAMREPSIQMVMSGETVKGKTANIGSVAAYEAFRAMIDAALTEKEKSE